MSQYIFQITSLILSFISCITFCYACFLQYKTMTMFKNDKRENRLQATVLDKVMKELKRKSDDDEKVIEKVKQEVKDEIKGKIEQSLK